MDKNGKCCVEKIILTTFLHSALQMRDNELKISCDVTQHVRYCKVIFAMSIHLYLQNYGPMWMAAYISPTGPSSPALTSILLRLGLLCHLGEIL